MSATTITIGTEGTLRHHWDTVSAACDELRDHGFVVMGVDQYHRELGFAAMKIGPITYIPEQLYSYIDYKPRDEWLEDVEHMYPCYRS